MESLRSTGQVNRDLGQSDQRIRFFYHEFASLVPQGSCRRRKSHLQHAWRSSPQNTTNLDLFPARGLDLVNQVAAFGQYAANAFATSAVFIRRPLLFHRKAVSEIWVDKVNGKKARFQCWDNPSSASTSLG